MRLVSLRIVRLPGIRPGFELPDLHPALNVITGANASGKSSVLRALRCLLDEKEAKGQAVHVEGEFEEAGERLQAVRLGDRVEWSRAGAPIEAPHVPDTRFLSCYTLCLEDLTGARDSETEIAERLTRELSGGYDLEGLRGSPPFRVSSQHGRRERESLEAAERELHAARGENQRLQESERGLASQREELERAKEAAAQVALLDDALALAQRMAKQRELRLRLADYPEGMQLLKGDEGERLAALRRSLNDLAAESEEAQRRREAAIAQLRDSGLDRSDLTEGDLAEAQALHDELARLEPRIDQERARLSAARSARERAQQDLGTEPAGEESRPRLDPAILNTVEEKLAKKRQLEAIGAGIAAQLDVLPRDAHDAEDPERLRQGRELLLSWLAAPAPRPWTGSRLIGLLLMLLAPAAAVALLVLEGGSPLLLELPGPLSRPALSGSLLAALFLLGLFISERSRGRERREYRSRFSAIELRAPAEWSENGVRQALASLDRVLTARERLGRELERRQELVLELEARREDLERERQDLAAMATKVGFDPGRLDAGFDRWLKLLHAYDSAAHEEARARSELSRLDGQAGDLLGRLARFLEQHGEKPGERISTALKSRLELLRNRLRARDEARSQLKVCKRELDSLEGKVRERRIEVHRLFENAGLAELQEPEAERELHRRLERLEEWQVLRKELDEASGFERYYRERLSGHDELLALAEAGDELELTERRGESSRLADRRDELQQRIGATEALIDKAGRDRDLQRARTTAARARIELEERYQETLFAQAGAFLLDEVEREHEAASKPELLRTAEEYFGLFTHHRFELRFDRELRLHAFDSDAQERRKLEELSTGTRAQLLVAVRVAFAMSLERGRLMLPLFLDEALTTADSDRFSAVVESLRVLSDAGRQIFYLTARSEDAAFWLSQGEGGRVIDVKELRDGAGGIIDPSRLELPEGREVPGPNGKTPEAYAVELAVPPLDLWAPLGSLHLFHLLRDDLALLHGLLQNGVERLGALRNFLDSHRSELLLPADEERQLRLRVSAAEEWISGRRVGRGRPVDRASLVASGQVSDNFIDRVDRLAGELGGDGYALLERLRSGAVSRFQQSRTERLAEWFAEHGHLDERTPLSEEELRQRVAEAVAQENGREGGPELLQLAARVCDYLETAESAASAKTGS